MDRRKVLQGIGAGLATTGLAGCSSSQDNNDDSGSADTPTADNNDGSSGSDNNNNQQQTQFTAASVLSKEADSWDSQAPTTIWKFKESLDNRSNGNIILDHRGAGEVCPSNESCLQKMGNDILNVAYTSIANSARIWQDNNVWLIPYTFPRDNQDPTVGIPATIHTMFKQQSWEDFWVPFGKKTGAVPLILGLPHTHRQLYIGTGTDVQNPTKPSDVEGLKIRSTANPVFNRVINEWGMNPLVIPYGETLQGLKSGVVNGAIAGNLWHCAFGMASVLSDAIINSFAGGYAVYFADVNWLKSVPSEHRAIMAEESKRWSQKLLARVDELYEQLGIPPTDGSCFAENDVAVTQLDEDGLNPWREPVDPEMNPGMYDDILNENEIGTKEFYNYIRESAREKAVPDTVNDVNLDDYSWWNEYLSEM